VQRQIFLPTAGMGQTLAVTLRIDVIVAGLVIVECKAVVHDHPVFEGQTRTCARLTGVNPGLVINLGERAVRNGIHRMVNGL